jgi:predicted transposase YbfD/YdcC
MRSFDEIFAVVPDPRDATALHNLTEILFIALTATLCGAEHCTEMEEFGKAKEPLLRQFLKLEYGIPSHDTFTRVFRMLDPEAFAEAFGRFTQAFAETAQLAKPSGVVAIDGKSLKRAYDAGQAHMPKMMVTAWGAETRMVLAQTEAPGGNEVQGALALLKLVSLQGCIVTADALHCHRAMAGAIRKAKADYALKLKGNQPALLADAEAVLAAAKRPARAETAESAHGRAERRSATVVAAPRLAAKHRFPGLAAVARIEAWRTVAGKTSHHVYHVLLSRCFSAAQVLVIVREHWGIENRLHWPLDVLFHEDLCRTRKGNGARNLAVLRHMSLNTLRAHPRKSSLSLKRRRAAWDDSFLLDLLTRVR